MNRFPCSIALVCFAAALTGCKPASHDPPKAVPAAQIKNAVTEADLATVILTPEAEQRLGIVTVPITRQKLGRTRVYGGELIVPLGRTALATSDNTPDRSIYSLLPATAPSELVRAAEMQIDADGLIAAAQVQLDAAKLALKRAEDLVANKAGTGRTVDEARTQVQLAEAALATAQARRALLGAPLFDAVKQPLLWVRVPIYVGDLQQIDRKASARLEILGRREQTPGWVAKPIAVPFLTTATPATADLYYEVANQEGSLRPGQKVTVAIPLGGEEENLVAPAGAVLYDIHGGTWVYENTAPHTFIRRRVELRYLSAVGSVLGRGPQPGAKIVSTGAAELYGTEFGAGK